MEPWIIPGERYYYGWYDGPGRQDLPHSRPDGAIKAEIVERLRQNPQTAPHVLRVDVKQAVVILQGDVATRLAKRAAGDDCWDTLGVADVSNQLSVSGDVDAGTLRARDVMTADPVAVPPDTTLRQVASMMADAAIGDVVVIDEERRPLGVVTDRDLVVHGLAADRDATSAVGDLMGPTIHAVAPDATLDDVTRTMRTAAIRRVVVVEDGNLLGIISLGDLAKRRDPGSVLAAISAAEPSTV